MGLIINGTIPKGTTIFPIEKRNGFTIWWEENIK